MSFIEIDPSEFMPRRMNRTYPRGIRHTPTTSPPEGLESSKYDPSSSNKQHTTMKKRKALLQTNAAILHKLTKAMRPKWQKELEALNLNPHNTTVEFTDSMQEEFREVIEQKLLSEPPHETTIDKLVEELYHLVENRERNNMSIGHVLLGKEPPKDPLLHGTVHIGVDGDIGTYHLKYWPQDDPGEPRELKGALNLGHLKLDLSHKSAGSKLLRNILTVRPRELSHSEADRVLRKIFTKPTSKTIPIQKITTSVVAVGTEETKTVGPVTEKYKPLFSSNKPFDHSPQDIFSKETSSIELAKKIKNITKTENENNIFKYFNVETSTSQPYLPSEVSDLKYFNTPSPSFDLVEEFKKLQDTISKSRNVSATLMEEMEACERLKNKEELEKCIKAKSDDTTKPFGSWKLQQRIREFRPQKPFPTMAPFVRRWPTFRTQSSEAPETVRPTLLTMRPKYGGPRHEPFFFHDFQRIRTVYPSTMATLAPVETTTDSITIDKPVKETTVDSLETTYTPKPETTTILVTFAPTVTTRRMAFKKQTKRSFSWVHKYRNDTAFTNNEIYATTEPLVVGSDKGREEKEFDFYKDDKIQEQQSSSTRQLSTTESYRKVTKILFPTSKKPSFVELNVSNKKFTVRPIFYRTLRSRPPMVSTTQPTTTTTFRSHIHAIKHKVKTGFKKLFSFFGFGKSNKEEQE